MTKWITNCLKVSTGTLSDYNKMAEYHYCTGKVNPHAGIFCLRPVKKAKKHFPDPIGIICFKMPVPVLKARNKTFSGFFAEPDTIRSKLTRVNENVLYLSRIIIDPRFHRHGFGSDLLQEVLAAFRIPIIETLTPIDKYNTFWISNGFKMIMTPTPPHYAKIHDIIREIGLIPDYNLTVNSLANRIIKLKPNKMNLLTKIFSDFCHRFRHHNETSLNAKTLKFVLEKMFYPNAYFYWKNPKVDLNR